MRVRVLFLDNDNMQSLSTHHQGTKSPSLSTRHRLKTVYIFSRFYYSITIVLYRTG